MLIEGKNDDFTLKIQYKEEWWLYPDNSEKIVNHLCTLSVKGRGFTHSAIKPFKVGHGFGIFHHYLFFIYYVFILLLQERILAKLVKCSKVQQD